MIQRSRVGGNGGIDSSVGCSENVRMLRLILTLILTAAATSLPVAHAQDATERVVCPEAVTTREMVECMDQARKVANAKLASLYKELRQLLSAADERLTTAQERWSLYQDAQCEAARGFYEGARLQV